MDKCVWIYYPADEYTGGTYSATCVTGIIDMDSPGGKECPFCGREIEVQNG